MSDNNDQPVLSPEEVGQIRKESEEVYRPSYSHHSIRDGYDVGNATDLNEYRRNIWVKAVTSERLKAKGRYKIDADYILAADLKGIELVGRIADLEAELKAAKEEIQWLKEKVKSPF